MKLEEATETVNQSERGAGEGAIHILCALGAEAQPLVTAFRLQRQRVAGSRPRSPTVYVGAWGNRLLSLTVCGVGSRAATRAVLGTHGGVRQRNHCAWLNVGIAGHGSREIGTPLMAHRISHRDAAAAYPSFSFTPPCVTDEIMSVGPEPEQTYMEPLAYDMEAHAFFTAAARHTTPELIHCFKVVSDNATQPVSTVNARRATVLIAAHLELLSRILGRLDRILALPRPLSMADPQFESVIERWRFTQTQRHQLLSVLQRLRAADPDAALGVCEGVLGTEREDPLRSAAEVISYLRARLWQTGLVVDDV